MMDVSTGSLELVSLLLMVLAGGIIATEFGTGTIKLLLITPHRRSKIFWSKALLLLEVILITSGAMFVMSFLVGGLLTGFADLAAMQVTPLFGTVVRIPYLLFILLKYLLFLLPVIAYSSLALMLSAVTRKSAVAIAVSILLMFGSEMVLSIVTVVGAAAGFTIPGLKFLLFSNTNLSAYFPSSMGGLSLTGGLSSTIDGTMTLGFSVIILLLYTVCFLWDRAGQLLPPRHQIGKPRQVKKRAAPSGAAASFKGFGGIGRSAAGFSEPPFCPNTAPVSHGNGGVLLPSGPYTGSTRQTPGPFFPGIRPPYPLLWCRGTGYTGGRRGSGRPRGKRSETGSDPPARGVLPGKSRGNCRRSPRRPAA